jgi:hypothetical protein
VEQQVFNNMCNQYSGSGDACNLIWGAQFGGTEMLDYGGQALAACAACTLGCGACAAGSLVDSVVQEVERQVLTRYLTEPAFNVHHSKLAAHQTFLR